MNITLVNTNDIQGGAARAAFRLYQGLRHIGQDVTLLCSNKASSESTVIQVPQNSVLNDNTTELSLNVIQDYCIDQHRSHLSNTFFSLPYPGVDLSQLPAIQQADVINLHWIARFQSPITIRRILDLGKPVVWTLHDMWAFTGGCHYSAGCLRYQQDCCQCPQLETEYQHIPEAVLADKLQIFQNISNLTIVAPSQWLSACARNSHLFRGLRVETIPYSLDTEVFQPIDTARAKLQLGIDPAVTTMMFGAVTAAEERKGFSELIQALWHCLDNPAFKQQVADKKIEILCAGYPSDLINVLEIPVRSFGYVDSDAMMSQLYSAADVFVLPSLEDNLPNTVLEAMSCGTPVVAFDVGGIPDMVGDRTTGRIVPLRDVVKLADAILECVFDPEQRQRMGTTARQRILENYALPMQAQHYVDLFEDLIQSSSSSGLSETRSMSESHASQPATMPNSDDLTLLPTDTTVNGSFGSVYDAVVLRAIATQLKQTKTDFHQLQQSAQTSQEHLQTTLDQLHDAQSKAQWYQSQFIDVQRRLQQTQGQLTQAHLQIASLEEALATKEAALATTRARNRDKAQQIRQRLNRQIKNLRSRIETLQVTVRDRDQAIADRDEAIAAVESSKFWKIRTRWINIKSKLGFKSK